MNRPRVTRDIGNPYLVMRWEADAGEIGIVEFAVPANFGPPASCGFSNPEYYFERPCDLRFTTPDGRQVYTERPLSPAFVPIGDTMVVIDHHFEDQQELGRLVDSLREKPARSIRQFSCSNREATRHTLSRRA